MKRAQLQAMETIIVAIVLILLVLLGLFIYVVGSEDVAEQNQRQGASEEILTLGTRLSNMMELSCSQRGRENSVCVDLVKAELLGAWLTDQKTPTTMILFASNTQTYLVVEILRFDKNTLHPRPIKKLFFLTG